MKGKSNFSEDEAEEIRSTLAEIRRAERSKQKALRERLRSKGFYITDWSSDQGGFTVSGFDFLVSRRLISVGSQPDLDDGPVARAPKGEASGMAVDLEESGEAKSSSEVLQEALLALSGERYVLADGDPNLAAGRGLYAFYGDDDVWRSLGLGPPSDDRPLYVGKAEVSIATRDLRGHVGWPSGKTSLTGRSTVRRSVVALLARSGGPEFNAVPRNPAKPERFSNYGLAREDDISLTEWMRDAFTLSVWFAPTGVTLKSVEKEVLVHWEPPLNLKDVSTPWIRMVKEARAEKAAQAKRSV